MDWRVRKFMSLLTCCVQTNIKNEPSISSLREYFYAELFADGESNSKLTNVHRNILFYDIESHMLQLKL